MSFDASYLQKALDLVEVQRAGGKLIGFVDGFSVICSPARSVAVEFRPSLDLGLNWVPVLRGRGSMRPRVRFGDSGIDSEVEVTADHPERARAFLDNYAKESLFSIYENGGDVELTDRGLLWQYLDDSPAMGRAARQLLGVARILENNRRELPPPPRLQETVFACEQYATSRDLYSARTPLRMAGNIASTHLEVVTWRIDMDQYGISILAAPAGGEQVVPFRIRPQTAMDRLRGVINGGDIRVGHAAFDAAFFVTADDEQIGKKICDAFDSSLCERLVALRSYARRFAVNGASINVMADPCSFSGAELQQAFDAVVTLSERISDAARAVGGYPYR